MPCDTVNTVSVEFGAKTSVDLLVNALKALGFWRVGHADGKVFLNDGYSEWINTKTGESQLLPYRNLNEIKRAYSVEVVKAQAKRFGWLVKQTGNNIQIIKR